MSNFGQGALAVVGGIVGFIYGGPVGAMYGSQIGLLAGTVLFPTVLPGTQGPRLTDHNTTSTQVGDPVPIVYGTAAVGGTVMWLGPIVETATTEEVGGKGAPTQDVTTYAYTQSIAIGLCEGEISGVRRIWENGELVYDIREQLTGETTDAFNNRLTQSAAYASTFDLYLGTETQDPDPTIETLEGTGNVPAFRGLAYIVYPNRALRQDQATRHPAFRFEVQTNTYPNCQAITQYSNAVMFEWANDVEFTPLNNLNDHVFTITYITGSPDVVRTYEEVLDLTGRGAGPIGFTVPATDAWAELADVESGASASIVFAKFLPDFRDLPAVVPGVNLGAWNQSWAAAPDNYRVSVGGREIADAAVLFNSFVDPYDGEYRFSDGHLCSGTQPPDSYSPSLNLYLTWHQSGGSGFYFSVGCDAVVSSRQYDYGYYLSPAFRVVVSRVLRAPDDPCHPRGAVAPPQPQVGYCEIDGVWYQEGDWTYYHDNQGTQVLRKGDPSSGILPRGPALHLGDTNWDNQAYWEAAYNAAVARGDMPSGLSFGANNTGDYPKWNDGSPPYGESMSGGEMWGYSRTVNVCTLGPGPVYLSYIVADVCERCGITDYDVSDIGDVLVEGYVITRGMPGREAIEPLRRVGFFDVVESSQELKFVKRGHDAVAVLQSIEIGAFESGTEAPPAVTTRKTQDLELPQLLRVKYISVARDYETGEELSPTRYDTDANEVKDVDVPVCLTSDMAARSAEVMWAEAWNSRWTHEVSVDQGYAALEPSDVIYVPIDGDNVRCRIIQVNDSGQILRKLSLIRDDALTYSSSATGATSGVSGSAIRILSGSLVYPMDLPALRDQDSDPGFYLAATSDNTGNTWPGVVIYRSTDGGDSYAQAASVINAATVGVLTSALGDGITTTWDDENSVFVTIENGSFESRTEEAVLNGANALAIGAHGRWEIVQFQYAQQLDATHWKLTHLLRGRRGTEHVTGSALAGDRVVLVSGAGIVRMSLQTSQIGQELFYKSVTLGSAVDSGTVFTFTGNAVSLKPLSPVHLSAAWSGADLVISWIRRGRLGQELPSGTDIPLSEESENYSIDIYAPGSPTEVIRTLTSVTQSVTYTAAQLATDFGSPTPPSFMVAVYQVSATVGRGYPGEATLTP